MQSHSAEERSITPEFVAIVRNRIEQQLRVARPLPRHGRIYIDRPLPFLCVYRRPVIGEARGTDRLVSGEALYILCSAANEAFQGVSLLVREVAAELAANFGGVVVLEIWARGEGAASPTDAAVIPLRPSFRIVSPQRTKLVATLSALEQGLSAIRLEGGTGVVQITHSRSPAPTGLPPLLDADTARRINATIIGIEVNPVYYSHDADQWYPMVLQNLRRGMSLALRKGIFRFTRDYIEKHFPHYHALGRHYLPKAVREVDERLASVIRSFDLLLQVTPLNTTKAWETFRRSGCEREPVFIYRPLPDDPELLRRGLFNILIEKIDDPTLAYLFREKQEEVDRQITMLRDRGSRQFLYESLQLYGDLPVALIDSARTLMKRLKDDESDGDVKMIGTAEFARRARGEFAHYRGVYEAFDAHVEVRNDIAPGLMVSNGVLLIGKGTRTPEHRVDALLQHEVGTHVLTWFNGRSQPLKQLYCGFAGYDEFQEGIAVLAEHLVGGLTSARLRVIAARVLAVQGMIDGASFVESWRILANQYGFGAHAAFTIAMRVHRGGGFTKDVIYLRGLLHVLEYLKTGGEMENLFVGKIAAHHLPFIRELQLRNVLHPIPLLPRYMLRDDALKRLERVRTGIEIHDMIAEEREQ